MRQSGDNLPLHRDSMRVGLVVECLAEGKGVFNTLVGGRRLVVETEMDFVELRGVRDYVTPTLCFKEIERPELRSLRPKGLRT